MPYFPKPKESPLDALLREMFSGAVAKFLPPPQVDISQQRGPMQVMNQPQSAWGKWGPPPAPPLPGPPTVGPPRPKFGPMAVMGNPAPVSPWSRWPKEDRTPPGTRPPSAAETKADEIVAMLAPDMADYLNPLSFPIQAAAKLGGRLTKRILKRADIRKGLDFASEAEKLHWDDFLKTWSDDTELLPQETIPFSRIQEEAAKIDPGLARRVMGAPAKDPTRHPAIFQHARERVNEINATVLQLSEKLKADLPDTEKWAVQGQIASLENDAKGTLDWIFRTGSEHGRNLAYHRIMAGQTFDDSYWLNRARRMAGGVIDEQTHRRLIEVLANGRAALAGGDKAAIESSRAALASELSRVEKSGIWETLSALRKAGLLTGVKTTVRNLGGNLSMQVLEEAARVPAVIADAAMSAFTHRRTVFPGRGIAAAAYEGATRGIQEAGQILKQGASTEDLLKMDFPRELNSGYKIPDWYTRGVFRWMAAQDRPFRAYAFRRSMEEQARGAAFAERRAGSRLSIDDLVKQFSASPTPEMQMQAAAYSEFAVFANRTRGTEAVRRGMSALTDSQRFMVDLFVPFKQTPSNIIARVVEYSGGGLLKGGAKAARRIADKSMTPQQQNDIAMALGRGTVGPALIYMGYRLAESGEMTGMVAEEPSSRAIAEEAGRLPGAVRIGDTWQQVSSLSPAGNLLTIGATVYEQETKPKPATLPVAIGAAGIRSVMEQPFLSGMEDVTGVAQSSTNLVDAAERMGQRMLGSAVPTAVADVGRFMDPSRRETRGQGLGASFRERLPWLREGLPPRRGVLGRELPQEPTAAFNPGIGSQALEASDPLRAELVAVEPTLGWTPKQEWEQDAEYRARAALTGKKIEDALKKLIDRGSYQGATIEERREKMQREIFQTRIEVNKSLQRNGRWIINPADRWERLKREMRQAGITEFQ